jgi:hypothetical protein
VEAFPLYIALNIRKLEDKKPLHPFWKRSVKEKKQAYIHFVTDKTERKSGIPAPTDPPQEWYVAAEQNAE